jgi:hypothetical protein
VEACALSRLGRPAEAVREELGHGFPKDFDVLLPRALDFVLGSEQRPY